MDGWVYGRMDGWIDIWIDRQMDGWMDGWIDKYRQRSLISLEKAEKASLSCV